MCYKAPGPRCSSHARAKLENLQAKVDNLSQQISDLQFERNVIKEKLSDNPHDQKLSQKLENTNKGIESKQETLQQQKTNLAQASKQYDSTPEGQKYLQDEIDKYGNNSKSSKELRQRAQKGKMLRVWQKMAYQSKYQEQSVRERRGNFITMSDRDEVNTVIVHEEESLAQ